jgi:hypothetical protein
MAVNRAPVPIIQDRTASTAEVRWQTTGEVYGEE